MPPAAPRQHSAARAPQLELPAAYTPPKADVARAAETFHRDGFVAVAGALQGGALLRMQAAAQRMCERIIALHTDNEWGARASFGRMSVTDHCLHIREWCELIDVPSITPILTAIFGSSDYAVTGGGGDVCFPGCNPQPLHQVGTANAPPPHQATKRQHD